MSQLKGQEKWSSVRITDSKKNSIIVENLVSIHSNLNLNGLDQKGSGKEVKQSIYVFTCAQVASSLSRVCYVISLSNYRFSQYNFFSV